MKIQLLSPAGEIHRSKTGIFKRSLRAIATKKA